MELNTTNPHCFTYQTEELLIELIGGVRIDGLDRMRVTIKVTVVNRKHAAYLTSTNKDMWISGKSRLSYGPNSRLVLNGVSGEIAESGRSK